MWAAPVIRRCPFFFFVGTRRIILEHLGSARNSWSLCERILTRQRQSETPTSVRGRALDEIQSRL